MCQRDRLCLLEMGESRHISMEVFLHDLLKRLQKIQHQPVHLPDFIPHIELHIQRHLIVPASSCVQLFAGVPNPLDQIRLHKTVDILILFGDLQAMVFHVLQDAFQPFQDLLFLLFRQNPLLGKHADMCHAALDILPVKFLVKSDGRVETIH